MSSIISIALKMLRFNVVAFVVSRLQQQMQQHCPLSSDSWLHFSSKFIFKFLPELFRVFDPWDWCVLVAHAGDRQASEFEKLPSL